MKPLVILAPYPKKQFLIDGWFRRIHQIETSFIGIPRLYIRIDKNHLGSSIYFKRLSAEVDEVSWNPENESQTNEIVRLVGQSKLLYCHTTHYAEHVRKLNFPGKMALDMHGAAPEEELLNGDPKYAKLLEVVESEVVGNCDLLIVVSNAMHTHLRNKGHIAKRVLKVAISSAFFPKSELSLLKADRNLDFIYAGGIQSWQKIDEVIDFLNLHLECSGLIATNMPSHRVFRTLRKSIKVQSLNGEELSQIYLRSLFGFALRDDSPVNRVASPTKLLEYISHGIVPILSTSNIGDLGDLGISFIEFESLKQGLNLDAGEITEMRKHNLNLAKSHHQALIEEMIELRKIVWEWISD